MIHDTITDPGNGLFAHLPTRRGLISRLAAGSLGALFGLGLVADGQAARCRRRSSPCRNNRQCCSNRCRRGFCYPRRR